MGYHAAFIACSPQGARMAAKLKQVKSWSQCPIWVPERYHKAKLDVHGYDSLSELVQQLFADCDCLVFFCACGIAVRRLCLVAKIDLKQQETGLLLWAEQKNLPLVFYSAQQLQQAKGEFISSAFVQEITSVDNVCARSATLVSNGGHLLVDKQKLEGLTVAAYEKDIELSFEETLFSIQCSAERP